MLKKTLFLLISCLFWRESVSDSQIQNIVSPKVDFTTNQLGSLSMTFHWQAFFKPNTILTNLKAKIIFPFALTAPLTVEWVQINDACVISSNMISTTTVASAIVGDPTGAHFFDMFDANYFPGAKYKMILRMTNAVDIPSTVGNTDPIKFEIVASSQASYLVYGYNYNFGYMRISDPAIGNFEFDLTPSYTDRNILEFTRDFSGMADVRITDLNASRILLKLDKYVFTDDAESTCNTIPDTSLGIEILDRSNFFCQFENTKKKGLYFVWKDGFYPPIDKTFRIRFRIQNPDIPGSTGLSISMYERYSPKVLKYKNISSAFSCGATIFGQNYPLMYVGPNLDTTSQFFPNVTLFRKGNRVNTITYNTIRLEFQTSLDLPLPAVSYTLLVTIGGTASTSLPLSLVYHDLPVALGFASVKVSIDATNTLLKFENVADLSSRSVYTVGFKVGFFGDEVLNFLGDNSFGAIEVKNQAQTYTLVNRKAPPGVRDSFKVQPVVNKVLTTTLDILTYVHSRPISSAVAYTYAALTASNAYGLRSGTVQNLFLTLENIHSASGGFTTAPVDYQSYIEVIASKHITAKPTANDNWNNANVMTNCFVKNTAGTDLAALVMGSCRYDMQNLGLFGAEYTRYRIGTGTPSNTFYSSGAVFGWRNVNITKMSSLMSEGTEAVVMDFYIKGYTNSYTKDISAYFPVGLEYSLLVNGYVLDPTQFTGTEVYFVNFNTAGGSTQDGSKVPTLMRISGLLTNANTFKTKKLVIFFRQMTALALDPDLPYEVGCNTASTADVKCYFYKGIDSAPCVATGAICYNYMSQSRIEILMSSTISSIADIYKLHIAVPMLMPAGMAASIPLVIGSAAQYTGTLSAFPDMLSTNNFLANKVACTSCPAAVTAPFSSVQVNAGTTTAKNALLSISLAIPTVGSTYSSQFQYNCNTADCTITNANVDFFSITYCSKHNFMSSSSFTVNYLTDVYQRCVPRISYQLYVIGVKQWRYCVYCPQWTTGTTASVLNVDGIQSPSSLGLKVPSDTWTALSGRQSTVGGTTYGLQSLSEQTLLTGNAYTANFINDVTLSPTTIYYDATSTPTTQMSLEINFTMTLTNPVPINGYFTFTSNVNFLFDFLTTPTSAYCMFTQLNLACTVTKVSVTEFYIRVTQQIPAGKITISLYALKSVYPGSIPATNNIDIYTSNSNGRTATNKIDTTTLSTVLNLNQYLENAVAAPVNILKLTNLQLKERVVNYRTELSMDVTLGNLKTFSTADEIIINLQGGTYIPSDPLNLQPVYCEIVDINTDFLIPQFSICTVSDLATVSIKASSNTYYNSFRVKILNYIVSATGPGVTIPTATLRLAVAPNTQIQAQVAADTQPAWPTDLAGATTINVLSITKQMSYFGLRPDFIFSITATSTKIQYETRVYVQFPAPYNGAFGSFPISCYQEDTEPIKLYCYRVRDRTLAITGFRKTVNAGSILKIMVYGVQQPLTTITEKFYVAIDSDADPGQLSEIRSFSIGTAPQSTGSTVPRAVVSLTQYSHNYIRANNSFLLRFTNSVTVPAGAYIYVYIDYLSFEFDIAGYKATCSVKQDQGSISMASDCVRQGNRYRITIGNTALLTGVTYTLLIEDIPTPDFYGCNVKLPELVICDSTNNLLAISTDILQNTDSINFITDEKFTYFTFQGLDSVNPVSFKKGIFNNIKVVRMDGLRMNDDFTFILGSTENGIFSDLAPSKVQTYHNHFGLAGIPVYLASTLNTFVNQIMVTINFNARFNGNRFAKLPLLRAEMTDTKTTLMTPPSVTVWTSKGSLNFYVKLREIPIQDSITFNVNFVGTTSLTCTPSSFTLGKDARLVRVKISSSHAAGASIETPTMNIVPSGITGYATTSIPITLAATLTAASTSISITTLDPGMFGLLVDIVAPKPMSFYTITMPIEVYRVFTLSYIKTKYESNQRTDGKYYIDYTMAQGVDLANVVVNENELFSKGTYKTIFYIEDIDGGTSTNELNFTTQDSPGGYGYVNLTFATPVQNSMKPGLVCYIAQIFGYPLQK